MRLADAHLAYLSTDPGISAAGTKGAAQHVREISETLARRSRRATLAVARRDGPEPLPELPLCTPDELLAAVGAPGAAPLDLLVERYALGSTLGRAIVRASGARHWLEVNAPLIEEAQVHRGLDAAAAAREREQLRALLAAVDGVLCVSPPLVRWCLDHGADPARVHLFPNGFCARRFAAPPPRAAARAALRLADDAFVALFAGGFRPWHDLPTLLDAFEQLRATHPHARLLLAGDGPERRALDATRLACLDVVDLGHVPARALPAVMAAADVGLSPNRARGGDWFCPLKIAEYQAAGLAVIATEGTGGHAPLDHGTTGLLVREGDAAALAAALRTLADDRAQRLALATAGQAQALALHSWERRVDTLEGWLSAPRASVAAGGVA
ncbi:MAG: glycosyltransferase family 4 protein [Planctomycetes bacterium]|nr:glycosyltransferase family 4 protein [Planctomycetota bacterium]